MLLGANKISINKVNDDQRDFVLDLMKGYNVNSFFETLRIRMKKVSLKHLRFI